MKGAQYTLLSSDPQRPKQPIIRHASQIKLYQQPAGAPPHPPRRTQTVPQHYPRTYDLPSSTKRQDTPILPFNNASQDHQSHPNPLPDDTNGLPPSQNLTEGPAQGQPEPQGIEPAITFCHPQEQIVGERRSKSDKNRKGCKTHNSKNDV